MSKYARLGLATLIATLAMTALTGTASADNFRIGPGGLLTAIARQLTFAEGGGEGTTIICNVTLNASLHNTLAKNPGALGGWITDGQTEACRSSIGGTTTVDILADLARAETWWHLQYASFSGTLPENISAVNFTVIGAEFLIRIAIAFDSIGCLYSGNVPAIANVEGGETIRTIGVGTEAVPLLERLEGFFASCPNSGRLLGGPFTLATANTIELI